MSCSRVCPLRGVQSFRNRQLHCGSLIWHSSCQKKNCLLELFCIGHSSFQDPVPVGSPWPAASFRTHPLPVAWGSLCAALWIHFLRWSSMAGMGATSWSSPQAAREFASVPGSPPAHTVPPCHSSLALVSAILFLRHFFSLLLSLTTDRHLLPFLEYGVTEVPQALLWVGSALASSGSVLEPAGTGSIRHKDNQGFFSQGPPPQSLCSWILENYAYLFCFLIGKQLNEFV